jgi:2-phospho-L-lactate guanylyltransferase
MESERRQVQTTAILPVKRLDDAHSRLSDALSLEQRSALAQALFLDMLSKLRRCRNIDECLVVTADPWVARHARWTGHEVLEQDQDRGHSQAAIAGIEFAMGRGAERVALLPIDCPMFEPAELEIHLGRTPSAAIVPDRHRTGTNALVLAPPDAFTPAFGPDSAARHVARARAANVGFTIASIDSLAFDLDNLEDLNELRDRLLLDPEPARRTATVLWEIGALTEATEATEAATA